MGGASSGVVIGEAQVLIPKCNQDAAMTIGRIPEEREARLGAAAGAPAPFETRFALLRDAPYGHRRVLIAFWYQKLSSPSRTICRLRNSSSLIG